MPASWRPSAPDWRPAAVSQETVTASGWPGAGTEHRIGGQRPPMRTDAGLAGRRRTDCCWSARAEVGKATPKETVLREDIFS